MALTKISGDVIKDGINVSGILTATKFIGDLTGNVNSSGVSTFSGGIQGNVTGNVSGNVNSTGVSTFTTLRATSVVGVVTAGITTAYVASINDGPLAGSRNRIINGDCRIDQRNNGGSVTVSSGYMYPVDRLRSFVATTNARWSVQRSGDAPVGFTSSFLATVTTQQTTFPNAGDLGVILEQPIEGFNVSDLNWGTSSAVPVTLSFWVKASVTGNYAAAAFNGLTNRSYVTSFTVNASNTWEYKTITIPGDTTGTWYADNRSGMFISLACAGGTTYQGTAEIWQSGLREYTSSTVNIFATNGATIRFTGIQLESGTVASAFERRSYGQDLALAQRYFETGGTTLNAYYSGGNFGGGTVTLSFSVTKRTSPIMGFTAGAGVGAVTSFSSGASISSVLVWWNGSAVQGDYRAFTYTASAEL